uniref:Ig-like domain-containing protein n=1 Tax=Poecilia formosa TaxID=48698 RepID=A0A096M1U2_POEFO
IMIIIITLLLLLCFSNLSLSKEVHQHPPSILGSPQSPATINCSHSISGYDTTLWYQKPTAGSTLKLIGYIQYSNTVLEKEFEDHFKISGDGSKKSELEVQKLQPEDSSMYYCAASRHSDSVCVFLLQKPSVIIQHTSTP